MRGRRAVAAGTAVAAAVLLVAGCSGGGSSSGGATSRADSQSTGGSAAKRAAAEPAPVVADAAAGGSTSGRSSTSGTAGGEAALVPITRAVVQNAEVRVRVSDVDAAADEAGQLARAAGGFVADESTATGAAQGKRASATLTLRIPVRALDRTLPRLEALGRVLSRSRSAQDVTEGVIDVESRLATQRASVARVRRLLSRARTIGEVVAVEGQLTRREASLESLQRRSAELADLTSLATVQVSLVLPPVAATPPEQPKADPTGFAAGLSAGWRAFAGAMVAAATVLGALLPFALAAAVIAVPVLLILRRRRPTTSAAGPAPDPTG